MKELLRFEHVSFTYEDGTEHRLALKDCSVSIGAGERVAVLGGNGAGKSTFFLLANGVLCPKQGNVFFHGEIVGRKRQELNRLRRGVGLVFQDPDVQILGGTVEEEISFGPMNLGLSREEVRRCVGEAVKRMRLEDLRQRAPQYLSGGEKKRVSIADALAMEPELLLMDEPAASLDPENCRILEETLEMLGEQGLALAVATHDVDFAWRWAQRILIFHDGCLAADRTPEELFSDTDLLAACHLAQPMLFRAARAAGIWPPPRTMEDVEQAVSTKNNECEQRGGMI